MEQWQEKEKNQWKGKVKNVYTQKHPVLNNHDLCDPDYMVDMLVNYSEEFDDISPALLASRFRKMPR